MNIYKAFLEMSGSLHKTPTSSYIRKLKRYRLVRHLMPIDERIISLIKSALLNADPNWKFRLTKTKLLFVIVDQWKNIQTKIISIFSSIKTQKFQ